MKKNLIVSLVGGQTFPNVQFAKWCWKEYGVDEADLIFITTEKMEKSDKSQLTADSLGEAGFPFSSDRSQIVIVDENDFDDIQKKLKSDFKINEYEKIIVNMTGGTKLMSLAAYQFFSRFGNVEIFYQSINQIVFQLYPIEKVIKSNTNVTLVEALVATGFSAEETGDFIKDYEFNRNFFNDVLSVNSSGIKVLTNLGNSKNIDGTFSIPAMIYNSKFSQRDINKAVNIAKYCGFNPEKITGKEQKFLEGGSWFEEYVYQYIQNTFDIPDENIALNMKIERGNDPNELDVIYMDKDNTIHIVECKALIGKNHNAKEVAKVINDALYKLNSISRKFGLKVKAHLYTKATNINQVYKDRAKEYEIEIVDGTMI